MTLSLQDFLSSLVSNPMLILTVLLTLGVIFVNGWTDAPNAIATCVSTRSMGPRAAILMAAVFNFLGVLVMTLINTSVAQTIYNMVDFGGNSHEASGRPVRRHCSPLCSGPWPPGISAFPPAKATP